MGLDDTELTEKIQRTHLQKLLSHVEPEDPRYKPFFDIYKGYKEPNGTEWKEAIINFAAIDPKAYALYSEEGRKKIYDARRNAAIEAGLIKDNEKLKSRDHKFLKISSNALRENVRATSPAMRSGSGWAPTAALKRQRDQERRPQRSGA